MTQSLQREHCNHEAVLPFVQSLHDGAFDDPAKAELAFQGATRSRPPPSERPARPSEHPVAPARAGIVFQTLLSYTEGFDRLLRQVQRFVGPDDVFFVEVLPRIRPRQSCARSVSACAHGVCYRRRL